MVFFACEAGNAGHCSRAKNMELNVHININRDPSEIIARPAFGKRMSDSLIGGEK